MNLKNYTSTVAAEKSRTIIEKLLVDAGASDISRQFADKVCIGIRFRLVLNTAPFFFELPARIEACNKVLLKKLPSKTAIQRENVMKQAERTAWKIISDWVAIQISMIQLEQAELLQVFLPYVFNPANEQTFYSQLKESGFKQLTNG